MTYRPWGLLDWTLALATQQSWTFMGALGTEERSLAAWRWLRQISRVSYCRLLEIHDLPSHHTPVAQQLLQERKREFLNSGGTVEAVGAPLDLLTELHRITAVARNVEARASTSLILDITSLPKRFSFPLLRYLEKSKRVRNLVLTYTVPKKYIEDEPLSKNATDWLNLPGFQGEAGKQETLVVSVGFMVESLQNHISTINKRESVKVLIPFPAPVSALRRTWESIYHLESGRSREKFEHHRVASTDLPAAFDRIVSLARASSCKLAFAPFGPKPISAAICLFATRSNCSVYYPQPRIYNPRYSTGVGDIYGKSAVYAYWLKHNGKSLYSFP